MDNKLVISAAAAAVLALGGGGAAIAAQQAQEENIKGGTITAPAGSVEENETAGNEAAEGNESAQAGQLQGLAKIDGAAAEEAALSAVHGQAKDIELENEGGFIVYEVKVAGDDGKLHEVVVDAGNGKVLAQETEQGED